MVGLPFFTVFNVLSLCFWIDHFLLLSGAALAQFIPWPSQKVTSIRLGTLLLGIGSWVIVSSGFTSSLSLLWTAIVIQAMGGGWTFQIALRFAGQLSEPEARPRVISAFYFCAYSIFQI
jgi:hypothetical protein